ncbi:hypothetical protein BVX93_00925 [bacterium B13(2017)]|nr:hypothetical protein BVX93_00925 [bacterium B13(2017)]
MFKILKNFSLKRFQYLKQLLLAIFILLIFWEVNEVLPFYRSFSIKFKDVYHRINYFFKIKPKLGKESAFILIDSKTSTALNMSFPYPRPLIARFLNNISNQNPKLIVFDFSITKGTCSDEDNEILAKSINNANIILLTYIQPDGTVFPIPEIYRKYVPDIGIIGGKRERDMLFRSINSFHYDLKSGRNYFPFSALLALKYFNLPMNSLELDTITNTLIFNNESGILKNVSYSNDFKLYFKNYYKIQDLKTISFIDVLNENIPEYTFKDKIVFIGRKDPVLQDIHQTVLGLQLGVVIVYNVFLTFINNSFSIPLNFFYSILINFLYVLFFLWVLNKYPVNRTIIITFIFLMCVRVCDYLLFCSHIFWNAHIPFSCIIIIGGFRVIYYYVKTWQENLKIKDLVILDPKTCLPSYSYFILHLRKIIQKSSGFYEKYWIGALKITIENIEDNNLFEIKQKLFAKKIIKKIQYRESIAWNNEKEMYCFVFNGVRSKSIHKRINNYFLNSAKEMFKEIGENYCFRIVLIPHELVNNYNVQYVIEALSLGIKKCITKEKEIVFFEKEWLKDIESDEKNYLETDEKDESEYVTEQIQASKNNLILLENKLERTAKEVAISERLASVGKIAAQIVHELKNPLGNLINIKLLFEDELEEEHPANKFVDMIFKEVNRMNKLCQQMLQFSKPIKETKNLYNINKLIEEVILLLKGTFAKSKIDVFTNFDDNIGSILINADQIKQVLFNLFTNAIEAIEGHGKVFIDTLIDGNIIIIKIKDTGKGIPKESIEKIFDLFYTTKGDKGTGIGLSTCFDIIKKHEGRILVDSEVENGTIFSIILPI